VKARSGTKDFRPHGGFAIALSFFGFFCLAQAHLIFRSTFFSRIIGGLLVLDGSLYFINSFANFAAPAIEAPVLSFLMVSGLRESSFCLWLLVVGNQLATMNEQTAKNPGAQWRSRGDGRTGLGCGKCLSNKCPIPSNRILSTDQVPH
jgi:hypothetical protein